jgi:competence protein ComFC
VCFKDIKAMPFSRLLSPQLVLCPKCFKEMKPQMEVFYLDNIKCRTLYPYDEKIRSLLFQFKGCFDIELAPIFLSYQLPLLKLLYEGYYLVPAPSFETKNEVRGFNHVVMMFESLGLPFIECLSKTKDVKQATSNFQERQKIGKYLSIDSKVSLQGKKILFVDDLITSGATAKECVKLIKTLHPKHVEILAMGHTKKEEQETPSSIKEAS